MVVNCAGLYADEVARLAGDDSFEIYPRKGEFFVFDPPGGEPLERILLPVPTKRTKGVLVFPTWTARSWPGPTAHDGEDKARLVGAARGARRGAGEGARDAARAGGRGADRRAMPACGPPGAGVNYVIGASARLPGPGERGGDPLDRPVGLARHRASTCSALVAEQGVRARAASGR